MKIPFTAYSLSLVKSKVHSVIHPDVKKLTEYAFTLKDSQGKDHEYYCFKNMEDMPYKRWQQLQVFSEEAAQNMSKDERSTLIKLAKDCINHNPILIVTGKPLR